MGPKFFLFHMLTCEVHLPLYGCPHIDLHASMQLAACNPHDHAWVHVSFFFSLFLFFSFYSFSSSFSFFSFITIFSPNPVCISVFLYFVSFYLFLFYIYFFTNFSYSFFCYFLLFLYFISLILGL